MASTINASTSGVGGVITTADATGVLDLQTADVTRASVSSSGLKISRVDSSNEGGQLDLCRSSDNTSAWAIDVYGNTSTPSLRFVDNVAAAARMAIDGSGNVGIGTASPTANFEIYGASSPYQITGNGTQKAFLGVDSGGGFSGSLSNHDFFLRTNNTNQVGVTTAGLFQFNSGYGSVATAYGCRAWVNFNGTGTVAIRGSGNVSSITDNGTGDYSVNFTTAMVDANYAAVLNGTDDLTDGSTASRCWVQNRFQNTSRVRINANSAGGARVDIIECNVSVFR